MSPLKKIVLALTISLSLFSFAAIAAADQFGLKATADVVGTNILPQGGASTIPQKVGTVVNALLGFIGIVFFILVLYAGFKWMTALGNTESVQKAKDIMEAAAIGMVIVLAAYAITKFVFTEVGGNQETPPPGGTGCCVHYIGTTVNRCEQNKTTGQCTLGPGEDSKGWIAGNCPTSLNCPQ